MQRPLQIEKPYKDDYRYDVALSFSNKDRPIARELALALKSKGIRVFYDEWAQAELLGKDLPAHLDGIYRHSARYCAILLSEAYLDSIWTRHELKSVLDRSLHEEGDYLLPLRIDSAKIPGIRDGIGYIDIRKMPLGGVAEIIAEKVSQSTSFLKPEHVRKELDREESLRVSLKEVPGFVRTPFQQNAAISDPDLVRRILILREDADARNRALLAKDLCRELGSNANIRFYTPYTCWLHGDRLFISTLPGVVVGSQKTFELRYFDGSPPLFVLSAEWHPTDANQEWGPIERKVFHENVQGLTADRSGCSMGRESTIHVLNKIGAYFGFPVTPFSDRAEPLCAWVNREPEFGWFDWDRDPRLVSPEFNIWCACHHNKTNEGILFFSVHGGWSNNALFSLYDNLELLLPGHHSRHLVSPGCVRIAVHLWNAAREHRQPNDGKLAAIIVKRIYAILARMSAAEREIPVDEPLASASCDRLPSTMFAIFEKAVVAFGSEEVPSRLEDYPAEDGTDTWGKLHHSNYAFTIGCRYEHFPKQFDFSWIAHRRQLINFIQTCEEFAG